MARFGSIFVFISLIGFLWCKVIEDNEKLIPSNSTELPPSTRGAPRPRLWLVNGCLCASLYTCWGITNSSSAAEQGIKLVYCDGVPGTVLCCGPPELAFSISKEQKAEVEKKGELKIRWPSFG